MIQSKGFAVFLWLTIEIILYLTLGLIVLLVQKSKKYEYAFVNNRSTEYKKDTLSVITNKHYTYVIFTTIQGYFLKAVIRKNCIIMFIKKHIWVIYITNV